MHDCWTDGYHQTQESQKRFSMVKTHKNGAKMLIVVQFATYHRLCGVCILFTCMFGTSAIGILSGVSRERNAMHILREV